MFAQMVVASLLAWKNDHGVQRCKANDQAHSSGSGLFTHYRLQSTVAQPEA